MNQPISNLPRNLGGYRLLERIGAGGMGAVYRAEDPRNHTTVAVKVIHEHLRNDHYVERFRNEAHLASLMTSPYIVRVLEFGIDEGEYFLVTEFVQGTKLADVIASGRLSIEQALAIGTEIAMALQAASVLSVVHRDIKPDNIIITPDGSLKLMDFGIARLSYVETQQLFLGTVSYAAPEQFNGQTDVRSDIYSLGIVLFQMLAGELPFRSDSLAGLMRQHQEAALPLTKLPGPRPLQDLVAKCLEKEPDRRYQDASELLVALHEVRRRLTSASDDSWLTETMLATVLDHQQQHPDASTVLSPSAAAPAPSSPAIVTDPPKPFEPSVPADPGRRNLILGAAGAAVLAIVLAVVLLSNGGGGKKTDMGSVEATTVSGQAVAAETPKSQSQTAPPPPAPGPATIPNGWKRFSSSGLEFALPPVYQGGEPGLGGVDSYATWLRSLGLDALASTMEFVKPNVTLLIYDTDSRDQNTNINVTRFPNSAPQSLDALTDQQAHNLTNANYRIVDRSSTNIGGQDVRVLRGEISATSQTIISIQFLFKQGDLLWIVSYNTTQQVYDRLRPSFDQSAQTIRISD